MSNFWQRTLSGAVYVSLVVASILIHPLFFGVLFAVVTALAVREYHHLLASPRNLTAGAVLVGLLMFALAVLYTLYGEEFGLPRQQIRTIAFVLLTCIACIVPVVLLAELFRKTGNPINHWGNFFISLAMVALPFCLMNVLLRWDKYVLLAVFITVWVNDTGAYCVGSLMAKRKGGNHKMCPRISPNKSWEGLVGGVLFALLAGVLFCHLGWTDSLLQTHAGCARWIGSLLFALVIAVFGTLGDLMESLFKRTIGVKDSGRFLPGHGGVLDRFDSMLLATPAVVIYGEIIRLLLSC